MQNWFARYIGGKPTLEKPTFKTDDAKPDDAKKDGTKPQTWKVTCELLRVTSFKNRRAAMAPCRSALNSRLAAHRCVREAAIRDSRIA
jgi:hypothetical protein